MSLRRRWRGWKRRQRSLVRYAAIPAPPRITAHGLQSTVRLIEIRLRSML